MTLIYFLFLNGNIKTQSLLLHFVFNIISLHYDNIISDSIIFKIKGSKKMFFMFLSNLVSSHCICIVKILSPVTPSGVLIVSVY